MEAICSVSQVSGLEFSPAVAASETCRLTDELLFLMDGSVSHICIEHERQSMKL